MKTINNVQKYIEARSKRDQEFAEGFEIGYADFKIGVIANLSIKLAS